jgi:hypothetical protein
MENNYSTVEEKQISEKKITFKTFRTAARAHRRACEGSYTPFTAGSASAKSIVRPRDCVVSTGSSHPNERWALRTALLVADIEGIVAFTGSGSTDSATVNMASTAKEQAEPSACVGVV